ncbi:hypothetical protein [Streptomyces sp. NPDC127197]|uniref:hypothetical protein n=1 Tax=Streptomyces sp. NPDC127197 TaxID=3345388 RepID=UPI0036308B6D
MSPEHRTTMEGKPPAKGKRRVGGLASVALLVAIGLITPAAAIAHSVTTHGGVTAAGDPKCKEGKDKDKCKPTPPPASGCNNIDSAVQGMTKYVSVVCNGRVRVLSVNEAGANPPTPVGGWQLVGGPTNVFDATLSVFDSRLLVTVLTSSGTVWQGSCTTTLPLTVPCTFTQMPTPPNGIGVM